MLELKAERTAGRAVGLDPTSTMVSVARARLARFSERVCVILGGDGDLDFPESSFDCVVALHSFQFWPAPADTAPRLRKLLRPSGRLVILLRNHERGAQAWLPNPLS